jgi:hypothetical protein
VIKARDFGSEARVGVKSLAVLGDVKRVRRMEAAALVTHLAAIRLALEGVVP